MSKKPLGSELNRWGQILCPTLADCVASRLQSRRLPTGRVVQWNDPSHIASA